MTSAAMSEKDGETKQSSGASPPPATSYGAQQAPPQVNPITPPEGDTLNQYQQRGEDFYTNSAPQSLFENNQLGSMFTGLMGGIFNTGGGSQNPVNLQGTPQHQRPQQPQQPQGPAPMQYDTDKKYYLANDGQAYALVGDAPSRSGGFFSVETPEGNYLMRGDGSYYADNGNAFEKSGNPQQFRTHVNANKKNDYYDKDLNKSLNNGRFLTSEEVMVRSQLAELAAAKQQRGQGGGGQVPRDGSGQGLMQGQSPAASAPDQGLMGTDYGTNPVAIPDTPAESAPSSIGGEENVWGMMNMRDDRGTGYIQRMLNAYGPSSWDRGAG